MFVVHMLAGLQGSSHVKRGVEWREIFANDRIRSFIQLARWSVNTTGS
jgi:Mrp family chromosome partitioning ATPase